MGYPRYPCRNCVYFNACGDNTRTAFCDGRMEKTDKNRAVYNLEDSGYILCTICKIACGDSEQIKFKLKKEMVVIPEGTTVRRVLDDYGFMYDKRQILLNGIVLYEDGFDKTFEDYDIGGRCFLVETLRPGLEGDCA